MKRRFEQWAHLGVVLGIGLWAFACSDGGHSTGTTGAAGGFGGSGGKDATSSSSSANTGGMMTASSSSSSGVTIGAGGFGGGPPAFVCDPPAEPGSLYENSAKSYDINDIDPVSMCKYRGKVLLIVNTAAA